MAKEHIFITLIIAQYNPDMISWLSSSIQSPKVLPTNLKTYTRDWSDGYGDVFIACQQALISEELVHEEKVETVICYIKVKRHKPLINCSIYRPPNNDILYMGTCVIYLKGL